MKDSIKKFFKLLLEKMSKNKMKTFIWIVCIIFSLVIIPALIVTVLFGAILVYSIFNPRFWRS